MTPVLLKCGCAANSKVHSTGGKKFDPPIDGCAIHDCIEPADIQPSLEGRKAKCTYGDNIVDSSYGLAFFKYRGLGSRVAADTCQCGYYRSAHTPEVKAANPVACDDFTPQGPIKHDEYYCGCQGWS